MFLFVPAANKGKVTHGKTPRVFYIFSGLLHSYSGSSWSYVKDLLKGFKAWVKGVFGEYE